MRATKASGVSGRMLKCTKTLCMIAVYIAITAATAETNKQEGES